MSEKYEIAGMSIVYVGPFGIAPYTHPEFQSRTFFPELEREKGSFSVSADSAIGKVLFSTDFGNVAVSTSSERLMIELKKIDEGMLSILERVPERFAAAVPTAMAVGVGFNVSCELKDGVEMQDGVIGAQWCEAAEVVSQTYNFQVRDRVQRNISIRSAEKKSRVDFNFDYRLAQPEDQESPLIMAKNWFARTRPQAFVAEVEQMMMKIVK